MTVGVDIYRYQTVTDYQALKRAVGWAWVKLTDGTGPAQVRGDRQVNGCRAAGIPVGGYHYAQLGDPIRQATVFLSEVERLAATNIAPALDLESPFEPNASTRDFGIRFCREVARRGHRPCVYMSASWAGALRPDQWSIPGMVIWIAAYGGNDPGGYDIGDPPKVTRYYSGRYDVHQHSSTATVPGISGQVDLNWALSGVPYNINQEADELDAQERNALFSIYNALFKNNTGETEHSTQGDQSIISRLVELQVNSRELIDRETGTVTLTPEFAAAVADALKERGVGGATPEDVEEAVRSAFARAGAPDGS